MPENVTDLNQRASQGREGADISAMTDSPHGAGTCIQVAPSVLGIPGLRQVTVMQEAAGQSRAVQGPPLPPPHQPFPSGCLGDLWHLLSNRYSEGGCLTFPVADKTLRLE